MSSLVKDLTNNGQKPILVRRDLEGDTVSVLVGLDKKAVLTTRQESVRVTMEGFEGDSHAGITMLSNSRTPHFPRGTVIRNSRQVSIVSLEELALVAALMNLPEILPQWLGANLCFRHIPNLTLLPPATRLFFPQDTVLVVEGENNPCTRAGRSVQDFNPHLPGLTNKFPKAAISKRGVVAWVERPGLIEAGDRVRVELARPVMYSY